MAGAQFGGCGLGSKSFLTTSILVPYLALGKEAWRFGFKGVLQERFLQNQGNVFGLKSLLQTLHTEGCAYPYLGFFLVWSANWPSLVSPQPRK